MSSCITYVTGSHIIVLHVQAAVENGHDVSGYSVVRRWMVVVVTDAVCD